MLANISKNAQEAKNPNVGKGLVIGGAGTQKETCCMDSLFDS